MSDAGGSSAYDLVAGLPDDVLTDRARDGDTRAFEALLRRYQRQMFTLALRITGSGVDADDVVQAAFTTAWRRLPTFRGDATLQTWLYRIVTNQALTVLRRRRPVASLPEGDHLLPPARGDEPEATAQHSALAAALVAALARLPVELRVAWLLRESEHRSYEEIASIVDESVSTVRGRIARARRSLADSMQEWR